ncbi:MAG: cation transporter [Chromatiales bacterium]|nr:MAG: cation transporter [Chromatiales bacterium]
MAGSSRKAIFAALVGNSLIAVTKFGAAAMTGSAAMLSEGIHSVVDTGNQVLLLLGLKRAQRQPSPGFPFGHGKEVYFWSFAVAILIFALGAGISLYQGYSHLRDPTPLENVSVNYIVLALAILFEAGAFTVAFREFNAQRGKLGALEAVRRGKDPTLFVVLFEDGAAMLGLLVALVGIFLADQTGNLVYDGAASMLIGLILAATAVWLAYETQSLLIGESAADWLVGKVNATLAGTTGIETVNEVATLHMGPNFILVTISVDFSPSMNSDDVETCVSELTREIKAIDPSIRRVFIEAEKIADHLREIADSLPGTAQES